jgi:glycine cleavage system H protein
MTAEDRRPTADNDGMQVASGQTAQPHHEGFAISPAVGGLPPIYVPQSPARPGTGLWHAVTRAARRLWPQHSAVKGEAMTGIPADLRYSKDHLWARPGDDTGLVRIGVTDFAQQSLGDVVAVNLPGPGASVMAGEPCGDIESTKSDSDLIAPVTGTVRTRNGELAESPELVNSDPYGQGWMLEVEIDPATQARQFGALMEANSYRQMAGA